MFLSAHEEAVKLLCRCDSNVVNNLFCTSKLVNGTEAFVPKHDSSSISVTYRYVLLFLLLLLFLRLGFPVKGQAQLLFPESNSEWV